MADNIRQFSWDRPLLYNGNLFPTTTMPVEDSKGNITNIPVFADANGMYHSLDQKGNELPIILQHTLPEVTVLSPRKKVQRNLMTSLTGSFGTPNPIVDEYDRHTQLNTAEEEKTKLLDNQNKQAIMRAAGYDVPNDGVWDSNQQRIWDSLTVQPKEYDTTLKGFFNGLIDMLAENTTYTADPLAPDEIKTYNPDNVDWTKTKASQNKFIKALDGTYVPIAVLSALPVAAASPVAAIVSTTGGLVGGKVIDEGSKVLTGRDFATNVSMYTPLTPGLGELFNPGIAISGIGAEKRMLDAIYNQITPFGYQDAAVLPGTISKSKELGLAVKDFFTPKRIDTSVSSTPAWKQRLDLSSLHTEKKTPFLLRDDAWRLAMRQKPRTIEINGNPHSLYIKNSDGTYSYDIDYINKKRLDAGIRALNKEELPILTPFDKLHKGHNHTVIGEGIGYNGGWANADFNISDNWLAKNVDFNEQGDLLLKLDEPFRLRDKWDVQPLKEEQRSFSPSFTRFANKHPNKVTDYLKNIEVVQTLGGKPFVLDMQVSPGIIGGFRIK